MVLRGCSTQLVQPLQQAWPLPVGCCQPAYSCMLSETKVWPDGSSCSHDKQPANVFLILDPCCMLPSRHQQNTTHGSIDNLRPRCALTLCTHAADWVLAGCKLRHATTYVKPCKLAAFQTLGMLQIRNLVKLQNGSKHTPEV